MRASVESAHNAMIKKIDMLISAVDNITPHAGVLKHRVAEPTLKRLGHKHTMAIAYIDTATDTIASISTQLGMFRDKYFVTVAQSLAEYYNDNTRATDEYYLIITSENFITHLNEFASALTTAAQLLICAAETPLTDAQKTKEYVNEVKAIMMQISHAASIDMYTELIKDDYETCTCGTHMIVYQELSELRCPSCGFVRAIVGAVFRDEQFYPQEGQKTKHGGYDTNRHYRFWIDRLQAMEVAAFDDGVIEKIARVIARDNYTRDELNCSLMRKILKDPTVKASKLNDRVPSLVKLFGGQPPPVLTFAENKICAAKFSRVMELYETINPDGGNKPYYPYFIYKIIEQMFRNNPEKLRLLDYIHLQSRETVIKNDRYYKQICEIASPEDDLIYTPTDPSFRTFRSLV